MPKKKSKAKVVKARITKHEELAEDRHLIDVQYELHGPKAELPPLPLAPNPDIAYAPLEITKKAASKTPEKHWYDFLTNW
jgi:hypothetical protein